MCFVLGYKLYTTLCAVPDCKVLTAHPKHCTTPVDACQTMRTSKIKRPKRDADRSPPSSSDVKNDWNYTSTAHVCLHDSPSSSITIQCHSTDVNVMCMYTPQRHMVEWRYSSIPNERSTSRSQSFRPLGKSTHCPLYRRLGWS